MVTFWVYHYYRLVTVTITLATLLLFSPQADFTSSALVTAKDNPGMSLQDIKASTNSFISARISSLLKLWQW